MSRFVSTMIYNSQQGIKRANMLTPDKLMKLPQDCYLEKGKPKSTQAQKDAFVEKIKNLKKSKGV